MMDVMMCDRDVSEVMGGERDDVRMRTRMEMCAG